MCGVSRCPAALWPHANMAGHLVRVLLNPCMCNSTGLLGKTRRLPHYLYTAASLFPSWQLKEVRCSKAANWASLLGVLSYDGVNKARKVADSLLIQLTQTISLTQFSILRLMYPPSLAGDTSMWMHVVWMHVAKLIVKLIAACELVPVSVSHFFISFFVLLLVLKS